MPGKRYRTARFIEPHREPTLENIDTNQLYDLAETLRKISYRDEKHLLIEALKDATGEPTPTRSRMKALDLFDDAINAVSLLPLREDRVFDHIQLLVTVKDRFVIACSKGKISEFNSIIKPDHVIPHIFTLGDTIASSPLNADNQLDRDDLLSQTNDLIQHLRKSKWNSDSVKAMLLHLEGFRRIMLECEYLSDDQIRRRVKSIYADFCAEFDSNFPPDKTTKQLVGKWAAAIGTGGIFMLGLAGNSASIAAYLEDHSSSFFIEQTDDPKSQSESE